MKTFKSKKLWIAGLIAAMACGSLHAGPQVIMQTFNAGAAGNYRANPNDEFEYILDNYVLGKSTDGTWMGVFCLEKNEYFNPGQTYDVALNNGSVMGGKGGNIVNNKDIISVGTAYLYEQFALGTLTGFTYGNQTHAQQLQNTIWYLEGEMAASGTGTFLALVQGIYGASVMDNYLGLKVRVMNLTQNGNKKQDQLVYVGEPDDIDVPDLGPTLSLLMVSLFAMAAARRRF